MDARKQEVARLYGLYVGHRITWTQAKQMLAEFDMRAAGNHK